jgi:hypothetical protein
MSPEERAAAIQRDLYFDIAEGVYCLRDGQRRVPADLIAEAICAAVEEERRKWVRLVESEGYSGALLAEEVRAR